MPLVVLIPAFNSARTLGEVLGRIGCLSDGDFVVVVDDGSTDTTSEIAARNRRVRLVRHPENLGYGRTSSALYDEALRLGATVTVNIHSDGAHFPEEIPLIAGPVLRGEADVVLGSRTLGMIAGCRRILGSRRIGACIYGPMPLYIFISNLLLTTYQNLCYGTSFNSFHDGFRACSRRVLEAVPYHSFSGWYQFDTQFLLAAHQAGFKILEVGVSTHYMDNPSTATPRLRYGMRVVADATKYGLKRLVSRWLRSLAGARHKR